jgi:hypothetical protein
MTMPDSRRGFTWKRVAHYDPMSGTVCSRRNVDLPGLFKPGLIPGRAVRGSVQRKSPSANFD